MVSGNSHSNHNITNIYSHLDEFQGIILPSSGYNWKNEKYDICPSFATPLDVSLE